MPTQHLSPSFNLLQYKELIEIRLDQLLPEHPHLPYHPLFTAARYSLLLPAKRIRPLLVLATLQTYGISSDLGIDPACAIEMIHTYSLIHDDLPCMDDDDFRRGKPSLHKVVGESYALLAGDYLLTYAFDVLSQSPTLPDYQKIALIKTLSQYAGGHGMIGGQVIDLRSEKQTIDWETLELMHTCKTAALITAALDFGTIIAEAPPSDRTLLQSIGKKIGIAFQIIDDLLDVTGTLDTMGKLSGSDAHKHKATSISILGIPKSEQLAQELFEQALQELSQLSRPAPLLLALFQQLVQRSC